jgi:hypothetical protein
METSVFSGPLEKGRKRRRTMPKRQSYAEHLKEWEETAASVAANASDLPQLEGARVQLEQMIAELRSTQPTSSRRPKGCAGW